MQPELNKLLIDIQAALMEIQEFTTGMDLIAYRADSKCKAAVERKFGLWVKLARGCEMVIRRHLKKSPTNTIS